VGDDPSARDDLQASSFTRTVGGARDRRARSRGRLGRRALRDASRLGERSDDHHELDVGPIHRTAGESVNEAEQLSSTARAQIAARAADDKKGENVVVLDVGEIIGIVDAFVITHASNTRLVRTIVDEVKRQLQEQAGVKPRSVEGLDDCTWVLLDYGDLVVHVFLGETREFYGLERLWADAPRVVWSDAAAV
jgi:ribosome-associated protein